MTAHNSFTTNQTIGPFFHEGLKWAFEASAKAPAVSLSGRVFDGSGAPVSDAMLEFWRPDVALSDAGMLRVPTDPDGRFEVQLPSALDGAPLAYVCVFARGLLNHYFTAVFAHAGSGELWSQIPDDRRDTLVAKRVELDQMQWDVRLQGANETVFFDYR